jgi:hypothetical protein
MEGLKFDIRRPRRFSVAAVLGIYACSLLLVLPLLAVLLVVTIRPLGVLAFILPLLVLIGTVFLSPLLGNLCVKRLVTRAGPDVMSEQVFIVQLTCTPRLRSGFRALIDDADDIGRLMFSASGLVFHGDSVTLHLPWKCLAEVAPHNVGIRGVFALRRRIALEVSGVAKIEAIEFAERSSRALPESGAITRKLYQQLLTRAGTRPQASSSSS